MTTTTNMAYLARIQGRATLYEMVVSDDHATYLVQYTSAPSRRILLDSVRKRGAQLQALTGLDSLTFASKARDGANMGHWRIYWTGRTEREAIGAGEYPFLA